MEMEQPGVTRIPIPITVTTITAEATQIMPTRGIVATRVSKELTVIRGLLKVIPKAGLPIAEADQQLEATEAELEVLHQVRETVQEEQ